MIFETLILSIFSHTFAKRRRILVVMVTEHSMDQVKGSTVRPAWQIEALNRSGFTDIELIDNFDGSKIKDVAGRLIHAHQLSGRFLQGLRYMVDIHGLEHDSARRFASAYPAYSWRKWAFRFKARYYGAMEERVFHNSVHLICSGETIYERVKNLQSSTIVRNAITLSRFRPTECRDLRVALVGPFVLGTANYYGLDMIREVVRRIEDVEFVFIGRADSSFMEQLRFKNAVFNGEARDYPEVLRQCSVLLAPYPEFAYYLGSKNKFLEAAACEMPVITTIWGAADFNNDLLLIGNTADDLVQRLLYLRDEAARRELGRKLRHEVEVNHNTDVEVKKLIKLYQKLSD